jgi:uncharacterized phage-associated protein
LSHEEVIALLTCFDIAEYFIWLANETGSFISNLKLQKLVYYSQAWYLAIYEQPLFSEDFQAWVHGPVVPELYDRYKRFSWQPIQAEPTPSFSENVTSFLEEVADTYFACDAYELERMTHLEDPWLRARNSLPPDATSNEVIRKEWMQEYYGSRVEKTQ